MEISKKRSNKTSYLNLGLMLVLTLAAQILMIFKSSRIAALYGTSVEMDAYNFVNSIVGFIFSFIGAGVGTVLIPYMARQEDTSRAQNGFLTILYGSSLLLLGIFFVLRRPILTLFSSESSQFVDVASALMAVILFSQLITSLNTVPTAFLQCKNYYTIPKLLALLVTLVATAVVYLADSFTIYQYALLSFLLILGEFIVQCIIATFKGFRYRPSLCFRDTQLQTMFRIFLPTVLGSGIYQLTLVTDSVISSTLQTGSLSILNYAGTISGMVNTIIAGNIMLYIYPKIAAEVNRENSKEKLLRYMALFSTLMCAVVVLFIAAGYDAVRILFERGAFNADATKGVFICTLIYLLGAPINIMRDVVYRYFYSKGNTKSTFYNGLFASLINIVISITFAQFMGLYGIVLGTTVTAVFSFVSIMLRMKKQYTFGGHLPFLAKELCKLVIATFCSVITCLLVKIVPFGWPSYLISLLTAVLSLGVFALVLFISRSKVFQVELG